MGTMVAGAGSQASRTARGEGYKGASEGAPMSLEDDFNGAAERVKTLNSRPSNDDLLELYALFKQGSVGDVTGKRPGMLDVKGRAKYDAWAKKKGTSSDDAKTAYIAHVDRLGV